MKTKIFTLLLLIFSSCRVFSQATNSCVVTNAGFESGTTTGWICKYGYYGAGACPTGTCPRFKAIYTGTGALNPGGPNAALNSATDRHVIVSGAGLDPNSNNTVPVVAPGGGTYSFRLGNSVAGGITVGGVNYAQAEAARLSFLVTNQNASFTYRYAYFVQDPSHQFNAQPTFEVVVLDQNDSLVPCGRYFVVAGNFPSCVSATGFQTGTGLWVYKNWTDVGLDLTGYINQNISIEFRTFDCFPSGGGGSSTSCVNNSCTYCTNGNCCTYTAPGSCTPATSGSNCAGNAAGSHSAYAYIDAYCSPLTINAPVFCVGASSINICAPTGYSSYTWPAGQPGITGSPTTQCVTINNPIGGTTYTVNMVSATGCPTKTTVTLQSNNAQVNSSTICAGSPTTLTATGGGTYSWDNGSTTSSIVVSPSSTTNYSVTVTNGACTAVVTSTVTVGNISLSATSTQAGCSVSNGTATANPSAGTPNYTYLWTPGGQTTKTATGLAGGTYTVLVTDGMGCTKTTTVNITATTRPTVTATSTKAGCSVSNGTATANAAGGTPGYNYLWTPGGQTTQTATGLAGGTYTVLVTDMNGCTRTTTVSIGSTTAPTATASSTQATCAVANGTGTVNPSGGTPGYSYLWNGGQTTQTATGFSPGTYTVIVTDLNGCTASSSVNISAANGPTVTVTASSTVSCNGGNNGVATATVTGGTPAFTYQWSSGQTTSAATGLSAGTYTIIVSDANNCSYISTIAISQPTTLISSISAPVNVSCNGGNDGSASATPSGGTPGYTYVWSNGQTGSLATGLAQGTYSVTIKDANGCSVTNTVTITQPTALTSSISSSNNINCNGGNNGSATITPGGGTPGYTYMWSNGQSTSTATGLSAGTYTVTVADGNGCTTSTTVSITQPAVLINTISSSINVSCNGGKNGSATITPGGGTPGYTYTWSNGQSTSAATGLSAGTYTVTVTDSKGCTKTTTVAITQPPPLTYAISSSTINCNGGNNGSATATPNGGTPGYTYTWSNGQTTSTATGLSAGTYTIIVSDSKGCTNPAVVTMSQPPALAVSVSGNDSICIGDKVNLVASVSGGTPVYTYVWNPGSLSGSPVIVSPSASTGYSVSITDANGCKSILQTFYITVLPSPTANFDTLSTGGLYGVHYAFTDSSSGATHWLWYFGDGPGTSTLQNPVHSFPGAGTYTVTQIAYNQYGCPDTSRIVITIPEGIVIPNVFTPNHDGHNDVWYIPNSGMLEFHVDIYDRWGAKVWDATADEIRWDGRSSSGKPLSDGTYYYVLRAVLKSGAKGKDYSTNGYVTLLHGKE